MRMRSLGLLLLSVVTLALFLSGCKSQASATDSNNPPVFNGKPLPTDPNGNAQITIAQAKQAFDKGNAVFVDVRLADAYQQEHIKGSINLPAAETGSRVNELPKDKLLITYCSCPAEQSSIAAVQMYNVNGYHDSAVLIGGTNAWKAAGYPMSAGSKP